MKTACPRCGANVSFMPGTQKLYCEYCGSQVDVTEFDVEDVLLNKEISQVRASTIVNDSKGNVSNISNDNATETIQKNNVNYDEYTCSTCGAKLITDETTTITDCLYCGSRQILKAKMQGEFNPKEVIPFKINRNQFISMYTSFVKKKILAPDEFKNNKRLMETKGIYVPFNLYFFDVDTYARGMAVRRSKDNKSYIFFEKEYSMNILSPVDSSKKFDDNMMTSLEPFDYSELKPFNPVYLNGFLSEIGNENLEELERKSESRGITATYNTLHSQLSGHRLEGGKVQVNFKKLENRNVLLPVWFINTWYNNKKYSYAINGQTGKIVGEIPLSKVKFGILMAGISILALFLSIFSFILFSDSDDGPFGFITMIWILVAGFFFFVKARYKNVKDVKDNPIQTWNVKMKKNQKYNGGQYKKIFGNAELNKVETQLFRNGKDVKALNK